MEITIRPKNFAIQAEKPIVLNVNVNQPTVYGYKDPLELIRAIKKNITKGEFTLPFNVKFGGIQYLEDGAILSPEFDKELMEKNLADWERIERKMKKIPKKYRHFTDVFVLDIDEVEGRIQVFVESDIVEAEKMLANFNIKLRD